MQLINTYTIEIKKSKFIAYLYDIESADDAKDALKQLKEEHKKARHIPYAYKVNFTASKSDDKEPSNTAGLPILQMMDYRNLENKLIAVVRYFGGTKLGVGPLMRAYLEAAKKVSE